MGDVDRALTKTEMSTHCRRQTKPASRIKAGVESLILQLPNSTDAVGFPLLTDQSSRPTDVTAMLRPTVYLLHEKSS